MTIDSPLTCYICGETPEEAKTVDLLGCLKDREKARERFKEKFGRKPQGYLFICDSCRKENPSYAKNVEKKYGIIKSP
ncbi:hypothetical protein C9439_04380 [archaeon SCG-AAA382B04]|nr:hypothetical protein C9439_04380 [archaeon SCG-AAA382B04]